MNTDDAGTLDKGVLSRDDKERGEVVFGFALSRMSVGIAVARARTQPIST
jgi:hypothetical protein